MSDRSGDQAASGVVMDREQLTRTTTSQVPLTQSDSSRPSRASIRSEAGLSWPTTVWISRTLAARPSSSREVGDTWVGRELAEPAHPDGPAVGVEEERDVGLLVHGVEQDRQHPLELRV